MPVLRNLKRTAAIAVILICTVACLPGETVKLYVAELLADERGGQNFQLIHEIKLVDGVVAESKEIMRFKPTTSMVFEGASQIIGNRYAVTPTGHILDFREHKVLFGDASIYDFLGVQKHKAYYRMEQNDVTGAKRPDVYVYDMTKQLGPVQVKKPDFYWVTKDDSFRGNGKTYAPSRKKYAAAKHSGNCEVWVYEDSGEHLLCKDMRIGVAMDCSEFPTVPLLWLNEKLLLTQKENGHIVKVDMQGKVSDVVKIECHKTPSISPRLGRNSSGDIIYSCGDSFVVDVEKGVANPYVWRPIGSKFSYADGTGKEARFRWGKRNPKGSNFGVWGWRRTKVRPAGGRERPAERGFVG